MQKTELFYTVGGNINLIQLLWENSMGVPKKLKIELVFDPTIPLLSTYPEKNIIGKDPYTPMFIASLLTIAKTWKQPNCPLTER